MGFRDYTIGSYALAFGLQVQEHSQSLFGPGTPPRPHHAHAMSAAAQPHAPGSAAATGFHRYPALDQSTLPPRSHPTAMLNEVQPPVARLV